MPEVPTIAGILGKMGYSSASVSSNFLISPEFGLAKDFDKSYWGDWWDPYLRLKPEWFGKQTFPGMAEMLRLLRNRGESQRFPHLKTWSRRHSSIVLRHPFLLDVPQHFLQKLNGAPALADTSWWLEPTLEAWLKTQRPEKPVLCFVNLLDAHEPYFSNVEVVHGVGGWLKYARIRQDNISSDRRDGRGDMDLLHTLYRQCISVIDRRIKRIVELLKSAGRWENTLTIITADHGQSFGEHGHLFHSSGIMEPVLRVPLWVRYPHGTGGGRSSRTWASLVDVLPTVLDVIGGGGRNGLSGYSLRSLEDGPRPRPVLTYSNGHGHLGDFIFAGVDKIHSPGSVSVAAYADKWKVVVRSDSKKSFTAFDTDDDPLEQRNSWNNSDETQQMLSKEADAALDILCSSNPVSPPQSVTDRLRAWGYV
jgi:arylsulfatase A-like enzyme